MLNRRALLVSAFLPALAQTKRRVLILCTGNSARSQM